METEYDMWNKYHWINKINDKSFAMKEIGNRLKNALDVMCNANNNRLVGLKPEDIERGYKELEKIEKELNEKYKEIEDCLIRLSTYFMASDEINHIEKKEE